MASKSSKGKEKKLEGHYSPIKQPNARFAVCKNCGATFEQVWRPKLQNYTSFDTCPKCRMNKGREIQRNTSKVLMPYSPHPAQLIIHQSKARFKILRCGSRFGKDRCSINEMIVKLAEMLSEERPEELIPPVYAWIVGPTYKIVDPVWNEFVQSFPKKWVVNVLKEERTMYTVNGGVIEARSADQPEHLVGVGLDFVLITEAARIPNLEEVWANLEMRLNSPMRGPEGKGGLAIINSTPVGKGFFYKMCRWGTKGDSLHNPQFEQFHFTSYDNPYIDHEFLDDCKARWPERRFKQEILAEFVDDAASVFTNPEDCATYKGGPTPEAGEIYVIGYDPARTIDFAGVAVRNSKGECVHITRWTGKSWTQQADDIAELSKYYNYAKVVIDRTGLGEALPEALIQRGVEVEAIYMSNQEKEKMVNNLAFLIEQKAISYPYYEPLINELKDYEYVVTKAGNIRYSASGKHHDDLVTAMMLAYKDFNLVDSTPIYMGLLESL